VIAPPKNPAHLCARLSDEEEKLYHTMWDELVPITGRASTPTGELLRLFSNLANQWSKEHVSTWAAHREVGLRVRDFGDVFAQLDERVPWKLVTFVAQSPTLEWPSDVFDDVFRALISYCSGRKQDRSTAANLKDVALAAELEDRAKRLRAAVASRLELDTPSDTEARLAAKKRPASAADT